MKIALSDVAAILSVHPRTVVRAYNKAGIDAGYDSVLEVDEVGKVFNFDPVYIQRVVSRQDSLLKPEDAAAELSLALRTFRYRDYPVLVRKDRVVRYSRNDIIKFHFANYML